MSETDSKTDQITNEVLSFISIELIGDDESVTLSSDVDLLGSGLVDSLGIMRLVAFLEETYATSVPPEDVIIDNFLTINSIVAYVHRKTG
jgi:acyl carrier protein